MSPPIFLLSMLKFLICLLASAAAAPFLFFSTRPIHHNNQPPTTASQRTQKQILIPITRTFAIEKGELINVVQFLSHPSSSSPSSSSSIHDVPVHNHNSTQQQQIYQPTTATTSFCKLPIKITKSNKQKQLQQSRHRVVLLTALQQWTPCLPIRGGKLKASKPFSTSNPQLPFICPTSSQANCGHNSHAANQSLNSLNSSYIWREATPNNFNLYSASIPSLNSYRYTAHPPSQPNAQQQQLQKQQQQQQMNAAAGPSSLPTQMLYNQREPRAHSEDRGTQNKAQNSHRTGSPAPPTPTPTPFQQVCKYKTASNYDNLYITSCNTPLLSRKNSAQQLLAQRHSNASSARTHYQNYPPFPPGTAAGAMSGSPQFLYNTYGQSSYIPQLLSGADSNASSAAANRATAAFPHSYQPPTTPQQAFLYDRRVNRSFDSPQEFARGSKVGPLRRSTPHLVVSDNDLFPDDPYYQQQQQQMHKHHCQQNYQKHQQGHVHQGGPGCAAPDGTEGSSRNSANSTSWCCGSVFKHWRKYHNYE